MKRKNAKQSKSKTALKATGKALKGAARGVLAAGSKILGAGAKALNPKKRIKVRNKYIDIVIKGQAKKTPAGWKVGKKTFEQGRGTVNVSTGYYLDRATGFVYAKRARNADHRDSDHPIEVVKHWRSGPPGYLTPWQRAHHAGQGDLFSHGIKPAKKRNAAKKKKSNASKRVHSVRPSGPASAGAFAKTGRKTTRSRKPVARGRKASASRNPSAESIRRDFAGSVNGERDLYFPQGTPAGKLAKLGKLVSITTEEGTIKPVSGTAWLCADTRGKLHIGSVSGAPLFDGPKRSFGYVTKLEYEASKPHLGYSGPVIWFHHAGEENGIRPTLRADGKGGLVFKGGDYRITRRGIEN